jgi:hypothetical protein
MESAAVADMQQSAAAVGMPAVVDMHLAVAADMPAAAVVDMPAAADIGKFGWIASK